MVEATYGHFVAPSRGATYGNPGKYEIYGYVDMPNWSAAPGQMRVIVAGPFDSREEADQALAAGAPFPESYRRSE